MLGKIRTVAGDLANAVTLWGLMGSLGLSGILGIVAPTVLQPILELPVGLRVLLGLCIFLVALAVFLATLAAFFSRDKASKGPSPQSSEYSLWQELKRIETENGKLKEELREVVDENNEFREWIHQIEPFKQRLQLKWTLDAVHRMGGRLHKKDPPDAAALEKWVSLTSGVIRKYYDEEAADFFLVHDGDNSFAGRLDRLRQVADDTVDFMNPPTASEFDITEALKQYPDEW